MAIFIYSKELGKVVPLDEAPPKQDDTRNHVNMRTTWSGTTQIEFSTTTIDESVNRMNGEK